VKECEGKGETPDPAVLADRLGRNPKTGESLLIKEHRVVVFRPTRHFWGEEKDKKDPT
jgi:hypothetical protein